MYTLILIIQHFANFLSFITKLITRKKRKQSQALLIQTIETNQTLQIDKLLGKGAYGSVYKLKNYNSLVAKKFVNYKEFQHELDALKRVGYHSNIITPLMACVTNSDGSNNVCNDNFIIVPLCDFTLFTFIKKSNLHFDSNYLIKDLIVYQIFDAVSHIHSKHLIHADIKPENIMLTSLSVGSPNHLLTLIDFGFCHINKSEFRKDTRLISSDTYRAPELYFRMAKIYDNKIDSWSVGIVLLSMFCGFLQFTQPYCFNNVLPSRTFHKSLVWNQLCGHKCGCGNDEDMLTLFDTIVPKSSNEKYAAINFYHICKLVGKKSIDSLLNKIKYEEDDDDIIDTNKLIFPKGDDYTENGVLQSVLDKSTMNVYCKALITSLLQVDPCKRLSIRDAFNYHPYFKELKFNKKKNINKIYEYKRDNEDLCLKETIQLRRDLL